MRRAAGIEAQVKYIDYYVSPLGRIVLAADDAGELIGLWFEGQKYAPLPIVAEYANKDLSVFAETKRWLDIYFAGIEPQFTPRYRCIGTDFQHEVWEVLTAIPYGKTMTYGDIARQIASKRSITRMSAQAVGGAVGRNPIAIIVPCHRVIGSDGSLTGYAGGIDKKLALLELERASGFLLQATQDSGD